MKPRHPSARDDCLFCRIASGEIEAHEVYRDERIVAFLDIGPIRDGHVQIVPVEHFDTFESLPPDLSADIIHLGQRLARVQKLIYAVSRVAFMFTGGDIPHAHAHVIPLVEKTDITSRRYIAEQQLIWKALPRPHQAALRETATALANGLLADEQRHPAIHRV